MEMGEETIPEEFIQRIFREGIYYPQE